MPESNFDVIVIGAGPGGYVAAIRAAQLGFKVACVEAGNLGGVCLNVGCIPSKALLDSSERYKVTQTELAKHGINVGSVELDLPKMISRKADVVKQLVSGVGYLFKKNKIEHLKGTGKLAGNGTVGITADDGGKTSATAKHIIIATGSKPVEVPGFAFDKKNVLSSTEALELTELPKKLLIVGGGYIGVEMGSIWNRLGTEVLVLEFLSGILPASDREMAGALQKSLEKQGMKFQFDTIAEKAVAENGKVKVSWKSKDGTKTGIEEVDKVLVCVGRKPLTEGLGLAEAGVKTDAKGFILADKHYATNVPGVYAIGDVIGGIMLAHKAEEEGVAVAELLAGKAGHVNYSTCPAVVYTHPELGAVGLTEDEAKAKGEMIKVGKFNVASNGRAKGMGETEGFVKVIADAKTDRLLGVHILSAHASDMIAECVVAMEFHASSEDLARTFHAHPTLPEIIKEAALAVDKRAIHS